ncbi:MAG: DUF1294 domain-containing protein [Provencibacterium sp.]|jgi:uncharacterized membrane protein YsdA (DUF1294 family)|nr:DUF1294 domain-containing protein [Provencibacterium sp.]
MKVLLLFLALINLVSFTVCGWDKYAAIRRRWRVPERRLLLLGFFGGALGLWGAMLLFRHKTRHWYFAYGAPAMLILQIAGLLWLMGRLA